MMLQHICNSAKHTITNNTIPLLLDYSFFFREFLKQHKILDVHVCNLSILIYLYDDTLLLILTSTIIEMSNHVSQCIVTGCVGYITFKGFNQYVFKIRYE